MRQSLKEILAELVTGFIVLVSGIIVLGPFVGALWLLSEKHWILGGLTLITWRYVIKAVRGRRHDLFWAAMAATVGGILVAAMLY